MIDYEAMCASRGAEMGGNVVVDLIESDDSRNGDQEPPNEAEASTPSPSPVEDEHGIEGQSEIIVFRFKEDYEGDTSAGCSLDTCHCDMEKVEERLVKFCDAVITFANCRRKMCPKTVKDFLCDRNLFGVCFKWLELGSLNEFDEFEGNGRHFEDGNNGGDNRDNSSSNLVVSGQTDHDLDLDQLDTSEECTSLSRENMNEPPAATSSLASVSQMSGISESSSLDKVSSDSPLSNISSPGTPCEDEHENGNLNEEITLHSSQTNGNMDVPVPVTPFPPLPQGRSILAGSGVSKLAAMILNHKDLGKMLQRHEQEVGAVEETETEELETDTHDFETTDNEDGSARTRPKVILPNPKVGPSSSEHPQDKSSQSLELQPPVVDQSTQPMSSSSNANQNQDNDEQEKNLNEGTSDTETRMHEASTTVSEEGSARTRLTNVALLKVRQSGNEPPPISDQSSQASSSSYSPSSTSLTTEDGEIRPKESRKSKSPEITRRIITRSCGPAPASIKRLRARNAALKAASKIKCCLVSDSTSETTSPTKQTPVGKRKMSQSPSSTRSKRKHRFSDNEVSPARNSSQSPSPNLRVSPRTLKKQEKGIDQISESSEGQTNRKRKSSPAKTNKTTESNATSCNETEIVISSSDEECENGPSSNKNPLQSRNISRHSPQSKLNTIKMLKSTPAAKRTSGYTSDDSQNSNMPLIQRLVRRLKKRSMQNLQASREQNNNPRNVPVVRNISNENSTQVVTLEDGDDDIVIVTEMPPPSVPKRRLVEARPKRGSVTSPSLRHSTSIASTLDGIHIKFDKSKTNPIKTCQPSVNPSADVGNATTSSKEAQSSSSLTTELELDAEDESKRVRSPNNTVKLPAVPQIATSNTNSKDPSGDLEQPISEARPSPNVTKSTRPQSFLTPPDIEKRRPDTPPRVAATVAAQAIRSAAKSPRKQLNFDPREEAVKITKPSTPTNIKSVTEKLQRENGAGQSNASLKVPSRQVLPLSSSSTSRKLDNANEEKGTNALRAGENSSNSSNPNFKTKLVMVDGNVRYMSLPSKEGNNKRPIPASLNNSTTTTTAKLMNSKDGNDDSDKEKPHQKSIEEMPSVQSQPQGRTQRSNSPANDYSKEIDRQCDSSGSNSSRRGNSNSSGLEYHRRDSIPMRRPRSPKFNRLSGSSDSDCHKVSSTSVRSDRIRQPQGSSTGSEGGRDGHIRNRDNRQRNNHHRNNSGYNNQNRRGHYSSSYRGGSIRSVTYQGRYGSYQNLEGGRGLGQQQQYSNHYHLPQHFLPFPGSEPNPFPQEEYPGPQFYYNHQLPSPNNLYF